MCIGYLQGTDPYLLSKLNTQGFGTMPLGNGHDQYGKLVNIISPEDRIRVVIGYLHKILPATEDDPIGPYDLLHPCQIYGIPVFIIVPEGCEDVCRKLLEQAAEFVTLVTLKTVEEELDKVLS